MSDEAGTGDGGRWLVEPPAPDEFGVVIRKGSAVELSDSVRAAIDELQGRAGGGGDGGRGRRLRRHRMVHRRHHDLWQETRIAASGGAAGPGGSSGTQAAPGGRAGPARDLIPPRPGQRAMKESRYNVWVEREGHAYVYNGVSGALLRLGVEEREGLLRFVAGETAPAPRSCSRS